MNSSVSDMFKIFKHELSICKKNNATTALYSKDGLREFLPFAWSAHNNVPYASKQTFSKYT